MYNKIFTKILDSSVWLESTTTRLVWLTLIASMDEEGFCAFAAMGNLANRARVPLSACEAAVKVLESPDSESADPANEGRRIERVPGGWIVLNAGKYRDIVTRAVAQEKTRERVRKHRASKQQATGNEPVTDSNDSVTLSVSTTPSTSTEKSGRALTTTRAGIDEKPKPIINGADLRRHGQHAWCDLERGLCVPYALHDEFKKKGLKSDAELKAWYPSVVAGFANQPVGDNVFAFWQSAFGRWVGTVAAPARKLTKAEESIAASKRILARLDSK